MTARGSAVAESSNREREVKASGAPERMLGEDLDFLKGREAENCGLELMIRKKADAKGDITNMVTELHRKTVLSYVSNRLGVNGALVEVSTRLKKAFACEARSLQRSVRDTVRGAAEETRGLFASTPVAIGKTLGVDVCRATGTNDSAKPEVSSSHTVSRGPQAGVCRDCPSSDYGS